MSQFKRNSVTVLFLIETVREEKSLRIIASTPSTSQVTLTSAK